MPLALANLDVAGLIVVGVIVLIIFGIVANWRNAHEPAKELRQHEEDFDLAGGEHMRFRRLPEFEPQGRERVGL